MKQTRFIMGMPVTLEVVDNNVTLSNFEEVYGYFDSVDQKFSTFKKDSEISKINRGEIKLNEYSNEMAEVLRLCEQTKSSTNGYFDIEQKGFLDPSGLVKGWAIFNAAKILLGHGMENFYLDVGGDIQTFGTNGSGQPWKIGIRNPFNRQQLVRILKVSGLGVATSGNYQRGDHIYNPLTDAPLDQTVSLTVVASNIYEADRFATAAFAMGNKGMQLILNTQGLEAYMIDKFGQATYTIGLEKYFVTND